MPIKPLNTWRQYVIGDRVEFFDQDKRLNQGTVTLTNRHDDPQISHYYVDYDRPTKKNKTTKWAFWGSQLRSLNPLDRLIEET